MTRANRRTCNTWSNSSLSTNGNSVTNILCEMCNSRLLHRTGQIFICPNCGLEHDFSLI